MSYPVQSTVTWHGPDNEAMRDGTYRLGWNPKWKRVYLVRYHSPERGWVMDTGAKCQPVLVAEAPYPKGI